MGTAQRWPFDRTSAVCSPVTGAVLATFAAVAKHYGVAVDICPPRLGSRKAVPCTLPLPCFGPTSASVKHHPYRVTRDDEGDQPKYETGNGPSLSDTPRLTGTPNARCSRSNSQHSHD